ncbi:MAG: cyclic nucleotide-binding domain-containing protein [Chloroflexi bacterium]|nr:cyclic nucleotide-binding domain-containing protein [Chloroflexota bacterium]
MSDLKELLKTVELFDGLREEELAQVAAICQPETHSRGDILTTQGAAGDELFVVANGFVEVVVGEDSPGGPRTVVNLGAGQIFGEMALVDQGPRSATVRVLNDNTVLHRIDQEAFTRLCEANTHLGYTVMRNMAADLSFKLRHRHLARR